jgi:hypothetical protein
MALSLDSIHQTLNNFFINQFKADAESSVLFRFDKFGSVISDQDFINPISPDLGYSSALAREVFSELVNQVPVEQDDGLNIFLSQNGIDEQYFYRLLSPSIPYIPEGTNDQTASAIISSFSQLKADANKQWANIVAASLKTQAEYKPSLAAPESWYDKSRNDVWTNQSFQVGESTATTTPNTPQFQLWKLKVDDATLQKALQAGQAGAAARPPGPNYVNTQLFIKSKLSGNVIDIVGASTQAGAPLNAWPQKQTGTDNQIWELVPDPAGSGYYFIKSKLNGNVIDIVGASTQAGAQLDAWPQKSTGTDNQLWELVPDPAGSGYYFIKSKLNGNVIDIVGASAAAGTRLDAWPQKPTGNDNQLWGLVLAPAQPTAVAAPPGQVMHMTAFHPGFAVAMAPANAGQAHAAMNVAMLHTVGAPVAANVAAPASAFHQQYYSLNVTDRVLVARTIANSAPTQPTTTKSISISFAYCLVKIQRPWYIDAFVGDNRWYIPSVGQGQLTSGSGTGLKFSLLPIGFVAVRKLSIEASWSADDIAAAKNATGFGPFKVDSAIVDNKLSHDGIQIIGWLLQRMPALPPNGDPGGTV